MDPKMDTEDDLTTSISADEKKIIPDNLNEMLAVEEIQLTAHEQKEDNALPTTILIPSRETNIEDFDLSCRISLLKIMKTFYTVKGAPSYEDIYEELKKQIQLTLDLPTAEQTLKTLGYSYIKTKTNPGNILMEDPKFTFDRFHYAKKILKFRSMGKHIYYLDERIIESGNYIKIPSIDVTFPATRKTVFIHVVSQDGYISGMFFYYDSNCYKKWLLHILLPVMKPSSVVVMNNALHGTVTATPISRYHTKNEMLQWLKERNIPCNSNLHKAELYDLIERCPTVLEHQGIDNLFRAHDIEVLRLTDQLRVLSLTTHFWKNINNEIKQDPDVIHKEQEDLQDYIYSKIKSFPQVKWFSYSKIIESAEKTFSELDTEIENLLDKYEIDKEYISSLPSIPK
ncbi:uncharacterized protein LOC126370087 [Pectinophora gossypiella]|uniref:uncharacterized protein LOC126370087 n=1 Tax=Pectinophora gossypiella TaxID=13191 RepID=UPI00214F418C|nr:uncharacterized protein LOC126370087 [Pectinophora gossypiella]